MICILQRSRKLASVGKGGGGRRSVLAIFYYFRRRYENVPNINLPDLNIDGGGGKTHSAPPPR